MLKSRRPGQRPKRSKTGRLPKSLVGRWAYRKLVFEFTSDGRYYVTGAAVPFSVSSKGKRLTINQDTVYGRTSGTGRKLYGTWALRGGKEELYFRRDRTYTSHWPNNKDYGGNWLARKGKIEFAELRAVVGTSGTAITIQPLYMPVQTGTWQVSGDRLMLTFDGVTIVYSRA